jgi:SSS family solute:Na+ symporter
MIGAVYGIAVPLVVLVAMYAVYVGYVMRGRIQDTESFLTARGEVGWGKIAWSFYAGAVGAWVIAAPPAYGVAGGILGLAMYSLSSGLPFLLIAFVGSSVRSRLPHVLSFTDYMGWRFGLVSQVVAGCLTVFNMCITLLAEYTTIGTIYQACVGSPPYIIMLVVGFVTLAYTTYGGLLVSIYTDQVQAIASVVLFSLLTVYLAVTFRPPSLPLPPPCQPTDPFCISGTPNCHEFQDAGVTCPTTGYSSIFVMPASLFTATIFSEAMWQRAWAAETERTLHIGAIAGAAAVVTVVFIAGLCGLLAAWAGLISDAASQGIDNPNLYLFLVLNGGDPPPSVTVYNWMGVVCVVLATVMNEGAVDSLQNGLTSAVTSFVSPMVSGWRLRYTRGVVVGVNVLLLGVAVWLVDGQPKVGVLELFLMTNLLCCCAALPALFGTHTPLIPYFGGGTFTLAFFSSILGTSVFGANYYFEHFPDGFQDPYVPGRTYVGGSLFWALVYTWIGNGYRWQFFLVPLCVSSLSVALGAAVNACLWSLWGVSVTIAGFTSAATHPSLHPHDHHTAYSASHPVELFSDISADCAEIEEMDDSVSKE